MPPYRSAPPPAAEPGLPLRPRLRPDVPLLWRDERVLQVGTGADGLVLVDVERALVAWAASLDGLLPAGVALDTAAAAGLPRAGAAALLRALTAAGAVDDAAVTPAALRLADPTTRVRLAPDLAAAFDRRAAATVRLLGTGRTADAVRTALLAAGLGRVETAAIGGGAEAATAPRPDADGEAGVAPPAALTVVAADDHPEVLEDPVSRESGAYLPVAVHGRRAVVGPLVVPGVTACLACEHLHRRDRDPAWPRLAVQLAHRRPRVAPVDGALATLAGSLAALQVLAVVEAGGPDGVDLPTLGAALEVSLPGGRWRLLARHPHPWCGCRWQSAAT